jgi:hypothetical protein
MSFCLKSTFAVCLGLAAIACSAANPDANRGSGASRGSGGTGAIENPAAPSGAGTDGDNGLVPVVKAPTTSTTSSGAGGSSGSMMRVPFLMIDQTGADNPAAASPADVQALTAGGMPGSLKFLYPYEGTVFPRGLLPPTLMWDGGTPDLVYVHIKSNTFEYRGVLKPVVDMNTMAPQLTLPEDVWKSAGLQTGGKDDPFTLELSARISGAVNGPVALHFVIAQATVKGSIYYNSYASQLPGAAIGGNVLRIPAGGKVELFSSFDCNGCHSVSADGSKMLSQINLTAGGDSFSLVSGGPANPMGTPAGARVAFGALYPDGSKYLSSSTSLSCGHAELAQPPGAPPESKLYDTETGTEIPDTGIPTGAVMPMFSPDGTALVFNDSAMANGAALAIMDYDIANNKATNYRMLMQDSGTTRPGWPFFLPDTKAVVFTRTDSLDFSGNGAYVGAGSLASIAGPFASLASAPIVGPNSELHIVDIETGTVTILAQAMGYATPADAMSGKTILPFPDDLHQNYFPTVAPIAAGGYFWVFFDSIRHYGNLGIQRQLWGAAIDIHPDGSYTTDPSHPAFYLPGQEFGAGNHRAFAALDPCKKDGDTCTSGIDCCGGACVFPATPQELVEPVGTCSPQKNTCAKRDERCRTDADCCLPEPGQQPNSCIAGFCAFIPLN